MTVYLTAQNPYGSFTKTVEEIKKDNTIHPLPTLRSTGSVKGDVKKVLEYRKSHVHPRGAQQAYLSLKGKR